MASKFGGIVRDLDPAELDRGVDPAPPPLVDQARAIQERIASERGPTLFDGPAPVGAGSGFERFEDDLPWADQR